MVTRSISKAKTKAPSLQSPVTHLLTTTTRIHIHLIKLSFATEIYSVYKSQITELNTFSYTNTEVNVLSISYVSHSGIPQQTPASTPIKTGSNITDCSSIKNQNNIGFECPVDRGSITVY